MPANFQPLHTAIALFFSLLVLTLFVRAIMSWLPIGVENPIVRFFTNLTAPMLDPVMKRLPRMSIGMFDLTMTVAFVFVWWTTGVLSALILSALPAGW